MSELANLLQNFIRSLIDEQIEIYNEFSFQHELGIFLRQKLPDHKVQFERNVKFFSPSVGLFVKKEIDISVFSPDKCDLKFAIELKYPRNGQYPEQMFSFCKDIAFAEQLKQSGFAESALVIFADDRLFYEGPTDGIYGFFRGGRLLHGQVEKPTGRKDETVTINGSYVIEWNLVSTTRKYALVEVS